jgi:hypothetical protein
MGIFSESEISFSLLQLAINVKMKKEFISLITIFALVI